MGSCVPFVFPWASSALLLTLYFHELLLTSLGFPSPITSYSSFGFMGLPSIPYSLCLHCFGSAAAHSYFFSHHILPMGLLLTTSLFPGSFEPICFLKAHLLISQTCDPLFMSLEFNGFCSLSFANFSVLLGQASFLTFGFHKKKTLNIQPPEHMEHSCGPYVNKRPSCPFHLSSFFFSFAGFFNLWTSSHIYTYIYIHIYIYIYLFLP